MKTNKSLSELFEQARNEAPEAPVSKVLSLLENGKSSPLAAKHSLRPRWIKQLFNPLKILVMIAPIVIITSALLIWNAGSREELLAPARQNPRTEQKGPNSVQETKQIRILDYESGTNLDNMESPGEPGLSIGGPVPGKPSNEMDTTLQGVILELTNEELTRLGFRFTPNGFMFLNRMEDGRYLSFISHKDKYTTHLYLDLKEDVHYLIDKDTTYLDFFPEAITNQQGKLLYDVATKKLKDQTVKNQTDIQTLWEHVNDTLVPVRINVELTGGYDQVPIMLWFKASDNFFSIIGPEKCGESQRIWRVAKNMSQSGGLTNHVTFTYQPYKDPENLLLLSSGVMKCMGFYFNNGDYTFYEYLNKIWSRFHPHSGWIPYSRNQVPTDPSFSGISTPVLLMGIKYKEDYYITNLNLIYEHYHQDSVDGVPYNDALELCIPVKIADTTLDQHVQDCIFWIYPNDRFLECLPLEIAGPMKKERNYQLKRMDPTFVPRVGGGIGIGGGELKKESVNESIEPVPCVYFTNLCESLSGLDYVNLYPNPATDKLNVDLVLQKAKKIRFRVIDLVGRVISDYGAPENYTEGGQFKHLLDISNLKNGLYMLVMSDEEGAKVTKRFVKN